jgi:hypothetical protein
VEETEDTFPSSSLSQSNPLTLPCVAGDKERSASTGRRRRTRIVEDNGPSSTADSKDVAPPSSSSNMDADVPSKGRRRTRVNDSSGSNDGASNSGGWMSTADTGSTKKTLLLDESTDEADVLVSANRDKHAQLENEGELLEIPDLDEEAGVDMDQRIAHAPKNVHRKIPTLSELEEEAAASLATVVVIAVIHNYMYLCNYF